MPATRFDRLALIGTTTVAASLLFVGPAVAAPGDSTAGEADRAQPEAASAPAAAAMIAVQDLEARLIQLRRELEILQRQRGTSDDLRRRIDELEARLAALTRQMPPGEGSGPAAEPSAPPLAGADPSTLLRPTLRLQGGFDADFPDRAPGRSARADTAGFLLRHAEVMLEGQVARPRFEYRLQVDFAPALPETPAQLAPATGALALLRDAFVQWRPLPSLGLRLGRFKVPFLMQGQYGTAFYEMVDQSAAVGEFHLDRDVGLMLVGRPWNGRLQYQVAATNGTATSHFNDNLDLAYAARVVAAPLGALPSWEGDLLGSARPLVAFGASATFNRQTALPLRDRDGDGRNDSVETWQAGAELRAVWRGAAVQAEYFRRWEEAGAAGPARRFWGGYVQASAFVLPQRLALAARWGRADRPLFGVAEEVRPALGRVITEQSGAVTYYVRGHDLKLQADYSHLRTDDAVAVAPAAPTMIVYSPRTHRVRVALQVTF